MKILFIILFLVSSLLSNIVVKSSVKFIYPLLKTEKTISDKDIIKLSKMSDEINGTKNINKYIGSLNLSEMVREDIYLRIAIYQNKLNRIESEQMIKNLKNVDGFSSTLSKIIGNNPNGTIGHLNELRIANNASKSGFHVKAIGKKFDDGLKKNQTDIDILLNKNGRDILIESKAYSSTTKMPLDLFRADLDTLNIYNKKYSKNKAIKIFAFTKRPESNKQLEAYNFWANKKGVELLFGNPEELIHQIKLLEKIK